MGNSTVAQRADTSVRPLRQLKSLGPCLKELEDDIASRLGDGLLTVLRDNRQLIGALGIGRLHVQRDQFLPKPDTFPNPQFAVLPQAGAVNKVRDLTISMLQAGQADFAKEGVRQYLEYRLSDLISKLRIPVPVDVAFNDNKQLAGEFLGAIDAAVKLHKGGDPLFSNRLRRQA